MLLNTEIKIIVTNDGNNNSVNVSTDKGLLFTDVITSFELAKKNYMSLFQAYILSKFTQKPTSKQLEKEFQTVTLNTMFNYTLQKSKS